MRFIAFSCFWLMAVFATVIHHFFVVPKLAAGPPDGSTCPPFERDDPKLGVSPGKGFDVNTQSHLIQAFGTNNICVNWDYSPSRELTSILYPAFEYSLAIYICLDFAAIVLANMRGEINPWFWSFAKFAFPINFFLCTQFRQIFVNLAYMNVKGHTAGYLGMQIALFSVTIQNILFVLDTDIAYNLCCDKCGGKEKRRRNTRLFSQFYLVMVATVNVVKLYGTAAIVKTGTVPPAMWQEIVPGVTYWSVIDKVGVVFGAFLPLYISYKRSKADYPLEIVVRQKVLYENDDDEETKPLR